MRGALAGTTFVIASACASEPPRPVEPAAPPLEIPPLPPKPEPAAKPATRPAPPPSDVEEGGDDDVEPSPLALPCRSDAECMTHRCNTRVGKCAFPCRSDRDCIAGALCYLAGGAAMAACIPKTP